MTNQLEVKPTILKSVSLTEAGPGDTLTYTLTMSNPGAPFTAERHRRGADGHHVQRHRHLCAGLHARRRHGDVERRDRRSGT